MSRMKFAVPETYVLRSSLVVDRDPQTGRTYAVIAEDTMKQTGHGDMPYMRKGDPVWRKPKPVAFAQHFKNEAARRRCGGSIKDASPADLKLVPVYQGCPARLANEIRAMKRREAIKPRKAA